MAISYLQGQEFSWNVYSKGRQKHFLLWTSLLLALFDVLSCTQTLWPRPLICWQLVCQPITWQGLKAAEYKESWSISFWSLISHGRKQTAYLALGLCLNLSFLGCRGKQWMLKDQNKHSNYYTWNRITMVLVTQEVAKKPNLGFKAVSYFWDFTTCCQHVAREMLNHEQRQDNLSNRSNNYCIYK